VSSTVVELIHKEKPFLLKDETDFFNFVKGIFRYRRKILKNSLRNFLGRLPDNMPEEILYRRPEQLTLDEMFQLYNGLKTTNL
jgi:16S rRNA A1518/A1519 N6-dimethyltransferase RsmA/KsgA/DIM1 with predicted DNA glycosylase/AP lyase activity